MKIKYYLFAGIASIAIDFNFLSSPLLCLCLSVVNAMSSRYIYFIINLLVSCHHRHHHRKQKTKNGFEIGKSANEMKKETESKTTNEMDLMK